MFPLHESQTEPVRINEKQFDKKTDEKQTKKRTKKRTKRKEGE